MFIPICSFSYTDISPDFAVYWTWLVLFKYYFHLVIAFYFMKSQDKCKHSTYCCDKISPSKITWVGKGLFHITVWIPSSRKDKAGTQGRNLKAEAKAQAMGEDCLLAFTQLPSSQNPELPAQRWNHPLLAEPCHTSHRLSKCPSTTRRLVYGQISWRHFLHWGSLFPYDPSLCQEETPQPEQYVQLTVFWQSQNVVFVVFVVLLSDVS